MVRKQEQPFERFLTCGAQALTNAELIALILRTGTDGRNATELARQILETGHPGRQDLSVLYELSLKDLTKIRGIGEVRAVKLLAITELSARLSRERAGRTLRFSDSGSIAGYYMEELRHERQEKLFLLLLTNRLSLIREVLLSVGTSQRALVSPREIFRQAVREDAAGFVLMHNHPCGDPAPSREDILVTRKILSLSRMMDLQFHDHVIIGDGVYESMRESGYMEDGRDAALP